MKFTGQTEVAAPLNQVFEAFADFESFQRIAMRSGAEIERVDALAEPGRGMTWRVRAELRGKPRRFDVELTDYEPPDMLLYLAKSEMFEVEMKIDLVRLSARETRANLTVDVTPKTIAARLLLQSARLTKSSINKRLRTGMRKLGAWIENRARA
jgi:uncharacterized protein YndB with AHSA1/START domain